MPLTQAESPAHFPVRLRRWADRFLNVMGDAKLFEFGQVEAIIHSLIDDPDICDDFMDLMSGRDWQRIKLLKEPEFTIDPADLPDVPYEPDPRD